MRLRFDRFDGLVALLAGLVAAILPTEPREAMARRYGVDPPFWSGMLGVVEALGGGLWLVDNYLHRVRALVDQGVDAAFAAGFEEHPTDTLAVMWSGSFAWLRWLTSPLVLFMTLAMITGAVRMMSFGLNREAVGEPLVWLGWRVWRGVRRSGLAAEHAVRFGPARADRVLPTNDGGLLVLTSAPRPEWNEMVTIEVGDRFFRLAEVDQRREDGQLWHGYRLREEDPTAVIRALLRYEAPEGALLVAAAVDHQPGRAEHGAEHDGAG
ncbi:MAG TPA: hypothetical protein VGS57_09435 [Thermoanaerobaculia bacterium]|nr:hypothetical protein [Thermoanaerobaculia bacterium]